jgi:hypothetical protein
MPLSIQIDRSQAMNLPNLQSLIDQLFDDLITVWLLDEL